MDNSPDFRQFQNTNAISYNIEVFYVNGPDMSARSSKERHITAYFDVSFLSQDNSNQQHVQLNRFVESLKGISIQSSHSHTAIKQVIVYVFPFVLCCVIA